MTREEIKELIQQTKAESLNENVVKESDLETAQKQSYAKGWNACNSRWIQALNEYLSKLQIGTCEDAINRQTLDEIKELMTDINGDTVYAVRMSDIRKLPPVTPKSNVDALGKARAEIQEYADNKAERMEMKAYYHCLQIIDKYKAENTSNCDSCEYQNEVDGSNCYECVKGIRNNYKPESEGI